MQHGSSRPQCHTNNEKPGESRRSIDQMRPNPSGLWRLLVVLFGLYAIGVVGVTADAARTSLRCPEDVRKKGVSISLEVGEDTPPLDAVLISHDHYDHLDIDTVKRLAAAHDPLFVVPLGLKSWLAGQGVTRVQELDWWGSLEHQGVRVVCVPAQHFSQRSPWDANTRLWASWAVIGASRRFYFGGDTGYFDGFRQAGERLGPFDLTALAIGA